MLRRERRVWRGARSGEGTGTGSETVEREVWRSAPVTRSEEHTSELQSPDHLVCSLLLEKKKDNAEDSLWNASALEEAVGGGHDAHVHDVISHAAHASDLPIHDRPVGMAATPDNADIQGHSAQVLRFLPGAESLRCCPVGQ